MLAGKRVQYSILHRGRCIFHGSMALSRNPGGQTKLQKKKEREATGWYSMDVYYTIATGEFAFRDRMVNKTRVMLSIIFFGFLQGSKVVRVLVCAALLLVPLD